MIASDAAKALEIGGRGGGRVGGGTAGEGIGDGHEIPRDECSGRGEIECD